MNGAIAGAVLANVVVHGAALTVSLIIVTAASRASARPSIVTVAPMLIEVETRSVPASSDVAPKVAELPTSQKTLHAWAPPTRATWLRAPVVNVDPAWMMKTAAGLPWASSVSVAVAANVIAAALPA